MNGLYTIMLLILSNVFMTLAWYGHLRLQQSGVSSNWPLIGVIAFSWMIAFFEYCCQVPANRLGFVGTAEGHPRVHLAGRLCHHSQHHVPRHPLALEPHLGISADYLCRLSCIYEIVS